MKKIVFILMLAPIFCYSQDEAPKKATKIFVRTTATIDTIELVLFQRGFTIDQKNKDLGIIITKPRELKGITGNVIARILLKDSIATITGECSLNMEFTLSPITAKNSFMPVKNLGIKHSTMKQSWYALYNIASKLGNQITFE